LSKSIVKRIHIKLSRKRNDKDGAKETFYAHVEHVPGPIKGLETVVCEE
jgi:large subunit ribosomal protein L31e